jgi:nitrile hydratase accessory protein
MTSPVHPEIGNMDGAAALPRSNGELVFEAPWEGRAFGLAVALNEQGMYQWREFQQLLIERIAEAETINPSSTYYERWLAALESLLVERGIVTPELLDQRTEEYRAGERSDDWVPHEHDNDDHDHDHDQDD